MSKYRIIKNNLDKFVIQQFKLNLIYEELFSHLPSGLRKNDGYYSWQYLDLIPKDCNLQEIFSAFSYPTLEEAKEALEDYKVWLISKNKSFEIKEVVYEE